MNFIKNKWFVALINELKQINNQSCFYFICSMKKIIENTDNIAFKFKIFDINVKNVSIRPIEVIEN